MNSKEDSRDFFEGRDEFTPEEIDQALLDLVNKGLVELHFDGEEFCFSVTDKGYDVSEVIKLGMKDPNGHWPRLSED